MDWIGLADGGVQYRGLGNTAVTLMAVVFNLGYAYPRGYAKTS